MTENNQGIPEDDDTEGHMPYRRAALPDTAELAADPNDTEGHMPYRRSAVPDTAEPVDPEDTGDTGDHAFKVH